MPFLPRDTYRIDVLDGGLNTKNDDVSCPDNMSPDLLQSDFSDLGSLVMSKGCQTFITALGTAQVDGMKAMHFSGTEELVVAQSGAVSIGTATATTWVQVTGATGVFTAGVDVCMRAVRDEMYMTNGYATPHRYDGSELLTIGVSAYTGGLTGTVAASATGGNFLAGSYYYGISGENANGVESNVATFSTLTTVAVSGSVELSGLPTFFPDSAGVETRYLYRTTAGSQTEFYRVTALTAAQTAFSDTISDTDLVTTAETDNNPSPKCGFYWYHRGRLFGSGNPSNPYSLYYSQAAQPEIWPVGNELKIGDGDGEHITAIAILGNSLVVHKSNPTGTSKSIWLVYMPDSTEVTDATNWYIVKSPSAYAAAGWKSIFFFENLMGFVEKSGMYAFTGEDIARGPATSQIGQYAADALSENIEDQFKRYLNDAEAKKIPAIEYDDKVFIGLEGSSPAHVYTYDYTTASQQRGVGAWSKHIPPDQKLNCLEKFGGALYMGGQESGRVYVYGTNYDINGSTGLQYYFTPRLAGHKKDWEKTKVWRYLYITMSNVSAAQTYIHVVGDDGLTSDQELIASGTIRAYQTIRVPIVSTASTELSPFVSRTAKVYISTYPYASYTTSTTPWQVHRLELEYLLRSRRT